MEMLELKRLATELKKARLLEASALMIIEYAKKDQENWREQILKTLGQAEGRLFLDILTDIELPFDTVTAMARTGWSASKETFLKVVSNGKT